LHLHIYKKPKSEAVDGKRGTITIGYSFNFINSAKKDLEVFDNTKNEKILVIDGIPFTQESLILFLILYHIASYHIFTRKRFEEA
jgi:predicted phosphatase